MDILPYQILMSNFAQLENSTCAVKTKFEENHYPALLLREVFPQGLSSLAWETRATFEQSLSVKHSVAFSTRHPASITLGHLQGHRWPAGKPGDFHSRFFFLMSLSLSDMNLSCFLPRALFLSLGFLVFEFHWNTFIVHSDGYHKCLHKSMSCTITTTFTPTCSLSLAFHLVLASF